MAMYLPSLSHWEYGNNWSGNVGRASYHAVAREREDGEREIVAEAWIWPPCYELATPERTERFPLSEEGLEALRAWLETTLPEMDRNAKD